MGKAGGKRSAWRVLGGFAAILLATSAAHAQAPQRPNIIMIMGDDVGWFNVGAYHQGIMAGRTPNLDRLAAEGMRFTDYYAEASCTAGRANFITGEVPIRTGLTTVGQAGSPLGIPAYSVSSGNFLSSETACHPNEKILCRGTSIRATMAERP